jgi:hypothetical protein
LQTDPVHRSGPAGNRGSLAVPTLLDVGARLAQDKATAQPASRQAEVAQNRQLIRRAVQQCGPAGHLGQHHLGDDIQADVATPAEISASGKLAASRILSISGESVDIGDIASLRVVAVQVLEPYHPPSPVDGGCEYVIYVVAGALDSR